MCTPATSAVVCEPIDVSPGTASDTSLTNDVHPPTGVPALDAMDIQVGYRTHLATASDVALMMEGQGVYDPSVEYGRVVDGHGTGLVPPTEEEYESMVGRVTMVDSVTLGSLTSLPTSLDLSDSPYFPAVGNQLTQNSCVAWAVGYYTTGFLQAREHNWTEAHLGTNKSQLMSPAWVYNLASGGLNTGITITQAIELVANHGQPTWSSMPYDTGDYTSWGDEGAWDEAPLHRIHGGAVLTTCQSPEVIKAWLAQGHLVPTMFAAKNFIGLGQDDPVVSSVEFDPMPVDHGITIVGYDDTLGADGDVGAFKVVNSWGASWGTAWGMGGFFWLTYDAFRETYTSLPLVHDRVDYRPSLLASIDHSSPGVPSALFRIGVDCDRSVSWEPEWTWSRDAVPSHLTMDMSDLAGWLGVGSLVLSVITWTTPVPTITSFSVELHETAYTPGSPTARVYSTEAPKTAPCTLNLTWYGVHVEVASPGNGTWHRGDVTVSGTAAPNLTYAVWDTGFEGDTDIYWTMQDTNTGSGLDTWGESHRRSRGGEVSMWCAGADGGAALFEDMDDGAIFGNAWRTTSVGPDTSPWAKANSGYRGCSASDRIAVTTSEGRGDVTEWLTTWTSVDCSVYENLTLRLYLDYVAGSGDGWGRIMWANGSTYPTYSMLEEFTEDTLGCLEYDVSFLDGEARVYLAFVYHGTGDRYMAIDDVALQGEKAGYDANMGARMTGYVMVPSGVDYVVLDFSYWLDCEPGSDLLLVSYVSRADGSLHNLWSRSGREGSWRDVRLEVPPDMSQIWFEFRSGTSRSYEGAFLDDIRLSMVVEIDEVLVELDGSEPQGAEGLANWSWTWGPTVPPSGLLNVTVRANFAGLYALDRVTLGIDVVPPWFGEDASPDAAETDLAYTFSIPVLDDVGLDSVWVEYWYGDGSRTNLTLEPAEDTLWERSIIVNATLEDLHYVFGCADLAGNVNSTAESTVDIVDVNGPGIINEGTLRRATTGDPHEFTITAGDNVGLKGATLWYAFGDDELAPVSMEVVSAWPSGNVLYSVTIDVPPDLAENITYSYEVEDLYGNVLRTHEEVVRVVDDDAPTISEDRTPATTYMGEDLAFAVVVSDNVGVGVVEVEYSMGDGGPQSARMAIEGDAFTLVVRIPEDEPGPVSYRFSVVDLAGNRVNGTSRQVTVVDVIPPRVLDAAWDLALKGTDVTFTVQAIDNLGVERGFLRYWFREGAESTVPLDDGMMVVVPIPRDAEGDMHLVFIVQDAAGNEAASEEVLVPLLNALPEVKAVPVWEVTEEEESTLDLGPFVSDANDDSTVLTLACSDANVTVEGLVLRARFDVAGPDRTIDLRLSDGEGEIAFQVTVRIANVNDAPVITSVSPEDGVRYREGRVVTFSVMATDEDGDELVVTWYGDGEAIGTGVTLAYEGLRAGKRTVRVEVSDGDESVERTFKVIITREEEGSTTGWMLATVPVLIVLAVAVLVWVMTRGDLRAR